jgi:hypothetical protein
MLCLVAGASSAALALSSFTLAWMHSIEKIRWEEDWRVAEQHLIIDEARILGSGAGMEPPADAALKNGVWHYHPKVPPQTSLRLTHSPHTSGYELCAEGKCTPLAQHLPDIDNVAVIELKVCP